MLYDIKSEDLSMFVIQYASVSYTSLTLFSIKLPICFSNARLRICFLRGSVLPNRQKHICTLDTSY